MPNCIICGKEFVKNSNHQLCCSKECYKFREKQKMKEYNKIHKKEIFVYQKEWRQTHKEEISIYMKQYQETHENDLLEYIKNWRQTHKEEIYEYNKEYRENNKHDIKRYQKEYNQSPKGKEIKKRTTSKRDRDLDFIPLNDWFEGSEGHHINKNYVIYIPKELHDKFKGHSARLNRKMISVNLAAFDFLINGKY